MNSGEISERIALDLKSSDPAIPTQPTLGRSLSREQMNVIREELKSRLSEPHKEKFRCGSSFWIVTEVDMNALCVFYDEDSDEFGLATKWNESDYEDIDVRGDLVGCYGAR